MTDGRLDIEINGVDAVVIVESKLHSTTSYRQMEKYIAHARQAVPNGERAIILLTRSHESWPNGVEEIAADSPEVRLIQCRWQTLGDVTREEGGVLAQDFVRMMEREGLVRPDPLLLEDWGTFHRAGDIVGRLWTLIDEARPKIETFAPGPTSATWGVGTHWLYRYIKFQTIEIGVGFSPSRWGHVKGSRFVPTAPAPEHDDEPVIYAWVAHVDTKDALEVSATEDHEMIEAVGARGAHPAGARTPRMIVASIRIPPPSAVAKILASVPGWALKATNERPRISAALVTRRPRGLWRRRRRPGLSIGTRVVEPRPDGRGTASAMGFLAPEPARNDLADLVGAS